MNSPLTRRSLLGATAAIGAVALPAPGPALATPAEAMSPEDAALLREFRDVAGRFNAASRRLDDAMAARGHVPEPDALFAREDDFWVLGCIAPREHWKNEERRFSYGFEEQIAQLRDLPAGDGNRRRADRRDEIVGAWDRWHAEKAAAREASGEAAASDHFRSVGDEHDAFLLRLTVMRTDDPDVMRIKAAAVLHIWGGEADRFDAAVERAVEALAVLTRAILATRPATLAGLSAKMRWAAPEGVPDNAAVAWRLWQVVADVVAMAERGGATS